MSRFVYYRIRDRRFRLGTAQWFWLDAMALHGRGTTARPVDLGLVRAHDRRVLDRLVDLGLVRRTSKPASLAPSYSMTDLGHCVRSAVRFQKRSECFTHGRRAAGNAVL